jgi:hypothetical protein
MAIRKTGVNLSDARQARYPWDQWSDGSTWVLMRGEDYAVTDASMQSAAYMYARRKGWEVSTSRHEFGVSIQFRKPAPRKKTFKKLKRK